MERYQNDITRSVSAKTNEFRRDVPLDPVEGGSGARGHPGSEYTWVMYPPSGTTTRQTSMNDDATAERLTNYRPNGGAPTPASRGRGGGRGGEDQETWRPDHISSEELATLAAILTKMRSGRCPAATVEDRNPSPLGYDVTENEGETVETTRPDPRREIRTLPEGGVRGEPWDTGQAAPRAGRDPLRPRARDGAGDGGGPGGLAAAGGGDGGSSGSESGASDYDSQDEHAPEPPPTPQRRPSPSARERGGRTHDTSMQIYTVDSRLSSKIP